MGLFGEEMRQVVTPDGRRITVPAQLAQAFPALQSAPPIDEPPPIEPMPPPGPVTQPTEVPTSGPPAAPRPGPAISPVQASDAGPPNTPAPMTNDQLAKIGTAGAYNESLKAQQEERAATQRQGEALANQATAVGHAMEAANAHADQLLAARAQAAQENAAALQSKTEEYQRDAKAVADTKVDRGVDHPVLVALSAALIGIGQAMGKQPIDAMKDVYKAIDRKVAGQMQDLDQKRAGLALQRDALGMQREAGRDRLAEMDTLRLGYIEQAKRQIEEIKQKTSSDVIRSNADVALAQLDQKSAETLGSAVSREQQRREAEAARKQTMQIHREAMGVQIRGQNLQQRQHDADRAERAQEKLDAISTQIALAKGKAGEDQAKLVREAGLSDPRTGNPILTPAGDQKMRDADKDEANARKASTPEQAAKLNEHAQVLRQSAQLNDVATARDKDDRKQIQNTMDASHVFADLADRTIAKLKAGPEAWNREEWAKLKSDLSTAQARYVATLGERVSVRALEAFQGVTSIDPDSWWSRTADKGKAIAALESLKTDAASWAKTSLNGAGVKTDWKPGFSTEETQFGGKTAAEVGADARPGGFRGDVEEQLGSAGARTNMDAAQEAALGRTNAKGQVNSYGLDPADNEKLRALVDQAGAGTTGHAKYQDIANTLAGQLTSDRPGWATAVARLVKDSDPKLYYDMLGALQPERAREIDSQITVAGQSPQRTAADLSDEERADFANQDLTRRLGAGVDRERLITDRREKATEEERRKYREAYDKRAAKGARGQ